MAKQCPNCGGFDTEMVAEENKGYVGFIAALFALPFLLSSCMFISSIFDGSLDWQWFIGAIVFLFLTGIIIRVFGTDPNIMKCNLCKFRWDARQDLPVHERPDLITLGEQRQHEEREKQQRDLEALWWLETYGKKK